MKPRPQASERAGDGFEALGDTGADIRNQRDRRDRNETGNDGVFDRCCAILITEQLGQHGKHHATSCRVVNPASSGIAEYI